MVQTTELDYSTTGKEDYKPKSGLQYKRKQDYKPKSGLQTGKQDQCCGAGAARSRPFWPEP